MMVFIVGGSGSGKSAYAEDVAVSLSQDQDIKRYYLATMQIFGQEEREKADRHRRLRSGKHFFTIEQPVDIDKGLEKMESGKRIALLECISNLTANEMFAAEKPGSAEQTAEKIVREVRQLKEETTHLVAVSGNVFEDGIVYDETTMEYIRAMGAVNQRLAAMADQAVEVVVGIPLVVAGG